MTDAASKEFMVAHRNADFGDVRLHYVEAGEGPAVMLLHGFPEFWWSWRFQIPALLDAGYRVIAPDMRGYNLSSKPKGVNNYRVETLARDVSRLIEACGAQRAAVVGHDWGAAVAWTTAMLHPERVERLAIMNVPHPDRFLSGLWKPRQLRKSWYMFALQVPGPPGRIVQRAVFEWVKDNFRKDTSRPGAFTQRDIDRYEAAMAHPGALTAATNYYRAVFRSNPARSRKLLRKIGRRSW